MKFVERARYSDPDAAARKLVEVANGIEAVQDGRIYIELINTPFLAAGGTGDDFRAGIERAVALGWLWLHEERHLREVHAGGSGFVRLTMMTCRSTSEAKRGGGNTW